MHYVVYFGPPFKIVKDDQTITFAYIIHHNRYSCTNTLMAFHYKETMPELTETCTNRDVINDTILIENCPK